VPDVGARRDGAVTGCLPDRCRRSDRRDRALGGHRPDAFGCAPNAVTWWDVGGSRRGGDQGPRSGAGADRRYSQPRSTRPHWHGPASNSKGSVAGCCASAEGSTRRANSAVPLDVPTGGDVSAIIDWYAARAVAPLVAAADRLFRIPPEVPIDAETLVMTGDVDDAATVRGGGSRLGRTTNGWPCTGADVPVDVLTAVIDGEVAFATVCGRRRRTRFRHGVARRHALGLGLSAVHVVETARRRGLARELCGRCRRGAPSGVRRAPTCRCSPTTPYCHKAVRVDGLFRPPLEPLRRCS